MDDKKEILNAETTEKGVTVGKIKKRKIWPYIALIIIGVIIFFSPALGKIYGYFEDKMLLSNWSDEEENLAPAFEPRDDLMTELGDTFTEEKKEASSVVSAVAYKPTVIGSINIPKLKLVRPIANDVQKRDLRVAIGKIPGSSGMGQAGNVTLAGHRNYAYKEFFDNLDKLEIGDTIILKNNKGAYTYEIYDIFITGADDVSVMAINRSEYICTLITCDPKYTATNRLIVKARLVSPEENSG